MDLLRRMSPLLALADLRSERRNVCFWGMSRPRLGRLVTTALRLRADHRRVEDLQTSDELREGDLLVFTPVVDGPLNR